MGILSVGLKLFNYGKKVAKVTPELILGTGSEAMGKAMRATNGSIFAKAEAGYRALAASAKPGFFSRLIKNTASIPSALVSSTKAGARLASRAGKSSILGGLKGLGKGFAKKMPLIGSLLMIGCELPNIFRAGKDEGVGSAIKETAKATARLGGGAVGAAIGSAICPGIGSLVGWIAGEWLAGRVVGPTYTEKKEAEAEAQTQPQPQVQAQPVQYTQDEISYLKQLGATDEQIQQLQAQGYTIADIQALLAQEQGQQTQPQVQEGQLTMPQPTQTPQPVAQYPQQNPGYMPYQNYTDMMAQNPYMMNPYMSGPFGGFNSGLASSPYADDIFFQQMFGYNDPMLTNQTMMNPYMDPAMYAQRQNLGFIA